MKCAKIIVKNNYEKRGDLVLRSYVRAIQKIHEARLLDGENAIIYGVADETGRFYELFTNIPIDYDDYELVTTKEIFDIGIMSEDRKDLLKKIIEKIIFNCDVDLDIEISTIEDLAKDRAIEFEAYDNYLSRINPYQRLNNPDSYNDYNNFLRKIEEIKVIKRIDGKTEPEFDEYEVLENPRKLVKKIV